MRYNGTQYSPLEYPSNIFFYNYNVKEFDSIKDPDGIYPIESPQWDIIWNCGDLYCEKSKIDEANTYYANDNNYKWYILIDTIDEKEPDPLPIKVTPTEATTVYSLDNNEMDLAVYFEDFTKLGTIYKLSNDGVVYATLSIGQYDGHWYWRTEVIDETREQDGTWPEYIQLLPQTLDNKINEVE